MDYQRRAVSLINVFVHCLFSFTRNTPCRKIWRVDTPTPSYSAISFQALDQLPLQQRYYLSHHLEKDQRTKHPVQIPFMDFQDLELDSVQGLSLHLYKIRVLLSP